MPGCFQTRLIRGRVKTTVSLKGSPGLICCTRKYVKFTDRSIPKFNWTANYKYCKFIQISFYHDAESNAKFGRANCTILSLLPFWLFYMRGKLLKTLSFGLTGFSKFYQGWIKTNCLSLAQKFESSVLKGTILNLPWYKERKGSIGDANLGQQDQRSRWIARSFY